MGRERGDSAGSLNADTLWLLAESVPPLSIYSASHPAALDALPYALPSGSMAVSPTVTRKGDMR